MPERWLLADVGGTHLRAACADPDAGSTGTLARLRNDDFDSLESALEAGLRQADPDGAARPVAAALAVAAPLSDAPFTLTNRDWRVDGDALRAALDLERVLIVNDFAAAAAGVDTLADPALERVAVLGPGTGLGAALLWRTDAGTRVLPGEAGHLGCGSADPDIEPLRREALARWGRLSWERLLCGDGLAWLDARLGAGAARTAAEVARAARDGEAAASEVARRFARLLGEFAGDLCLAWDAQAAWIVGGVADGLGDALDDAALRAGFDAKGRLSHAMPARRIGRGAPPDLALRGLARIARGQVRAPARLHADRNTQPVTPER